jgi:hypothetical protein
MSLSLLRLDLTITGTESGRYRTGSKKGTLQIFPGDGCG